MTDRRSGERRKTKIPVPLERRKGERRAGDRRQSARAPLDLWVEEEQGDELYFRRTGNVSMGGLYFEQSIPHAAGTKVKLRFVLPGETEIIDAAGEIVNTPDSSDGLGMGLQFTALGEDDRRRLRRFIREFSED